MAEPFIIPKVPPPRPLPVAARQGRAAGKAGRPDEPLEPGLPVRISHSIGRRCPTKHVACYASEKQAQWALADIAQRATPGSLYPIRCYRHDLCGYWHLTAMPDEYVHEDVPRPAKERRDRKARERRPSGLKRSTGKQPRPVTPDDQLPEALRGCGAHGQV